jgi:predicted O-methyltransferase YrrM
LKIIAVRAAARRSADMDMRVESVLTGGKVITTDMSAANAEVAQAALAEAGFADFMEIRLGDARDTI